MISLENFLKRREIFDQLKNNNQGSQTQIHRRAAFPKKILRGPQFIRKKAFEMLAGRTNASSGPHMARGPRV